MRLKQIESLRNGKCVLVSVTPKGRIKMSNANYNSKLGKLFCAYNSENKVLGYTQ
jgi:hypothetical protein